MSKHQEIVLEDYEQRRDMLRMSRKLARKQKHKHRQEWMDELNHLSELAMK